MTPPVPRGSMSQPEPTTSTSRSRGMSPSPAQRPLPRSSTARTTGASLPSTAVLCPSTTSRFNTGRRLTALALAVAPLPRPANMGAEFSTPARSLITRVIVRENKSGKGANAANLTTWRTEWLLQHTGRGRRSRRRHQQQAAQSPSRRVTFINNATGAGGAAGTVACGPGTTCSSSEGNRGNGGALEFDDPTQCTITADFIHQQTQLTMEANGINQHEAVLTITDSQFTGNSSTNAGGAVNCNSGAQACTVQRSTFASNSSTALFGGGAMSFFNNGTKTLTNCTFANNSATSQGGGILARSGPVSLNFVTMVGDRSDSDNNGSGDGGALKGEGAALTVKNSLFAGNTKGTATAQIAQAGSPTTALISMARQPAALTRRPRSRTPTRCSIRQDWPITAALPRRSRSAKQSGRRQGQRRRHRDGGPARLPSPVRLASIGDAPGGDASDVGALESGPGTIQFTTATQSVNEAAGTVMVTVSRTFGTIGSIVVTCSTAEGTAKETAAGAGTPDYTATQATLSWPMATARANRSRSRSRTTASSKGTRTFRSVSVRRRARPSLAPPRSRRSRS